MCVSPLWLIQDNRRHIDFLEDWRHLRLVRVPCGKCVECMKKRQNDIAVRVCTEAQNYNSMHFVTLTYDDAHLPLWCSLFFRFKADNSIFKVDKGHHVPPGEYLDNLRSQFAKFPKSSQGFVLECPFPVQSSEVEYFYKFTPSLKREDVRLWLKKSRIQYERIHGEKLPNFKYVLCGEMGSRTARPHYHVLFLGLSDSQVHWLCDRWIFGFTLWKRCNTSIKDKFAVSRYISKYMTKKGRFECDTVREGLCEKPRYTCSKLLGVLENPSLSFYYCFDIVGKYNPKTLIKENGMMLSSRELLDVYDNITKRLTCSLPGCSYNMPLPRSWIKKIYYEKKKIDGFVRYVPIRLFRMFQDALVDRELADSEREFVEFASRQVGTPLPKVLLRFKAIKEADSLAQTQVGEKAFVRFYSNDSF